MMGKRFFWTTLVFLGVLAFFLPAKAVSAKSVSLSGSNSIEIGTQNYLKLDVRIDTEGETVGAIEFDVNFNTETLSGKSPEVGGSICNFIPIQQASHIMCGFYNGGFNGEGLLATLVFQGKQTGEDTVSLSNLKVIFNGTTLAGYQTNQMNITVYGEGLKPTPTKKPISTPTPVPTKTYTPIPTKAPGVAGSTSDDGTTSGYETQVPGQQGSTPEDPLKPAEGGEKIEFSLSETGGAQNQETLVKDIFSDNQKALFGFFPTIILLVLVIHLGIKLYFTEKRRRLELEKLFEDQLGSLSSLESKLDLLEQKGEQGKERFIQEFETTKSQLLTEVNPTYQG